MSFDWRHYLELAEYMNSNVSRFPEAEACYRSAASRAYYSVFCLARNYVKDIDSVTFHANDHKALQDHLTQNPRNKARSKIGNQLRQLHQIRIKADYNDNLHELPANTANQAVTRARKIEQGLMQLSAE